MRNSKRHRKMTRFTREWKSTLENDKVHWKMTRHSREWQGPWLHTKYIIKYGICMYWVRTPFGTRLCLFTDFVTQEVGPYKWLACRLQTLSLISKCRINKKKYKVGVRIFGDFEHQIKVINYNSVKRQSFLFFA